MKCIVAKRNVCKTAPMLCRPRGIRFCAGLGNNPYTQKHVNTYTRLASNVKSMIAFNRTWNGWMKEANTGCIIRTWRQVFQKKKNYLGSAWHQSMGYGDANFKLSQIHSWKWNEHKHRWHKEIKSAQNTNTTKYKQYSHFLLKLFSY